MPVAGTVAVPQASPAEAPVAAILAIVGGAVLCLLTLYGTVYEPLHYDFGINYGEGPQLADPLAFVSGLAAIAIGLIALSQRRSSTIRGAILILAGAPTLCLSLLWIFPSTFFGDDYYYDGPPLYFGHVFFTDIARLEIGSRSVNLPLLAACAALITAGFMMGAASSGQKRRLA